jgi:hypothetical protein
MYLIMIELLWQRDAGKNRGIAELALLPQLSLIH